MKRTAPAAAPSGRKSGNGLGRLILLGVLGVLAFQLTRCFSGQDTPSAAAQRDNITAYATRETRIRPAPATGNTPVGELARGDRVRGEWAVGADGRSRWLKLRGGAYDGDFVWGANLSDAAPPRLAEVVGEEQAMRASGPVLAAPRRDADRLADAVKGQKVRVAGKVNDDWVEVTRSGGGVGYVSADLLGPRSGRLAPAAEEERLSVELVDPPSQ